VHKLLSGRLVVLLVVLSILATGAFAQVAISVSFGPPALPVYTQPLCPQDGYIWVPGYWAYDPNIGDYYWVPGTWVPAPEVGYLWTPPWWGWSGGAYLFHAGYWGPTIGFYGGINYGYGYFGHGYEGGRWNNGRFFYNRSVNNINVTNIRNVYNVTVVNNNSNRVSYNGGNGGIQASPTAAEEAAARERHVAPVEAQRTQQEAAAKNQQMRASVNQGRPPIAATPKAGTFNGAGVVRATSAGAPYHPPARGAAAPGGNAKEPARPPNEAPTRAQTTYRSPAPVHARDVPPHNVATPPNGGNTEAARQVQQRQQQQRQQQMNTRQQQEHDTLQKQQEQDHQRMAQQQATSAQMQQMERQHQQQTMQMEQRHTQEQRQVSRPAPAPSHNEAARPPERR